MAGPVIAVNIPAPGGWISTNSNRKRHPHAQAKVVRAWRTTAAEQAAGMERFTGPVIIEATIHKARNNRWDLDGITPTVKACIDGLRDAGILEEDDDRHVRALNLRVGCVCRPARVELRVWGIATAPSKAPR